MIDAILSLFGATPDRSARPAAAAGFDAVLLGAMSTPGGKRAPGLAVDVPLPDPELARVAPELRARLARVIARMRQEYGHEVQVVEGWRSGARQDHLFAQGRTRPGPIVTWTQESAHELGRAADLMVNGGYSDLDAYRTLQRVAREEGLRTLGLRDPGHVELPGPAAEPSLLENGNRALAVRPAGEAGVTGAGESGATRPAPGPAVARVATVARVADVAPVAQVARVARVAVPGASASGKPTRASQGGVTPDASHPIDPGIEPIDPDIELHVDTGGERADSRTPAARPVDAGDTVDVGRAVDGGHTVDADPSRGSARPANVAAVANDTRATGGAPAASGERTDSVSGRSRPQPVGVVGFEGGPGTVPAPEADRFVRPPDGSTGRGAGGVGGTAEAPLATGDMRYQAIMRHTARSTRADGGGQVDPLVPAPGSHTSGLEPAVSDRSARGPIRSHGLPTPVGPTGDAPAQNAAASLRSEPVEHQQRVVESGASVAAEGERRAHSPDARLERRPAALRSAESFSVPARSDAAPDADGRSDRQDPSARETSARDRREAPRRAASGRATAPRAEAAVPPTTSQGRDAYRRMNRAEPAADSAPEPTRSAVEPSRAAPEPAAPRATGPLRGAEGPIRPDVAGRVEAVDGVRSQSDAQPVRRVSVRVGEGQDAARVRVALQGEAVQAEMGTRSARLARQLGHELPELTRALQQHGMELDGLRVRQGDRVVADVITPRAAEAGRTPETGTSSRNEGSGTQTQRHAQDGRDRRRDSNQEGDE